MSKIPNDLFTWKNYKGIKNKPKINTEFNENPDLNYWKLRTVQATDDAIKTAFCDSRKEFNSEIVSVDESIYCEAKDLVNSWFTNKKVYGIFNDKKSFLALSDEDEYGLNIPTKSEVHKEWEHLINKIETKENIKDDMDSYLSSDYEDRKLKSVLSNLHKKTFVDSTKLRRIDASKSVDFKRRIENRQEVVKRNREERLKKEEMKKMEKLAEKEARAEATKMLKEEQKLKEISIRKEEELLQKEMDKIRKELQRKREEEQIEFRKLKETQNMIEKHERKNNSARKMEETSKKVELQISKSSNDRFDIISQYINRMFNNKNVQIVRKCFQAWKNELINIKIKTEKASVWFQWKSLRKSFRAWHQYVNTLKINMKIDVDQNNMKLLQMKETMAADFWKRKLIQKCIINWCLFVIEEKENRWFQKLEEMRKNKMLAYIKSVEDRALENQEKINVLSLEKIVDNKATEPNDQFSKNKVGHETERRSINPTDIQQKSTYSECKSARPLISKFKPAKEIWQITKKDVYLPIEDLIDNPDQYVRKSLKPPKIVNSFVHRDAAQKEIIKQQKIKLKEQERLIEEIKSSQRAQQIKDDQGNKDQFIISPTPSLSPNEVMDDSHFNSIKSHDQPIRNKFVLQMEARAKERERIKAERIEKLRKNEEEKKRQLEEKFVEQAKIELKDKLQKERLQKEKLEKLKQKEELKQKRIKLEMEANEKADTFYRNLLLKNYGVKSWHKLLLINQINLQTAKQHYSVSILRKVFGAWSTDVRITISGQDKLIKTFYDQILLRRCFHHMKLFKYRFDMLEKSAEQHYLNSLLKNTFQLWRLTNHRERIRMDKLDDKANDFYVKSTLKKYFIIWRELPMAKRLERQKERRKEIMRQKVSSIIPDFKLGNLNV